MTLRPNPAAARRASVAALCAVALLCSLPAHAGTGRLPVCFSMVPDWPIQAKDFAFLREGEFFHLFWMRHDLSLPYDSTERDLGHAVSRDLKNWTQLPPVLGTRPGKWDNLHIWAPSILKQGDTFYLYYTGVTAETRCGSQLQRIGVATSTNLLDWTRSDRPVLSGEQVPWAFADASTPAGRHFRDPFAMPDPTTPGRTLLYYVATPAADTLQLIVGVAQTTDMVTFADLMPLWDTGAAQGWGRCESPQLTEHNGLTYLFVTTPWTPALRFRTAAGPLADSTGWSSAYRLDDMADQDPDAGHLFASEVLSIPGHDYLAAVNGIGYRIDIYEIAWDTLPPGFSLATPVVPDPQAPAHIAAAPALNVLAGPGTGQGVRFLVTLPDASPARIELFDLAGRRLLSLLPGSLPKGESQVGWNGRLENGSRAPSGLYFAVLTVAGGRCSTRVPVLN